MDIFLDIIKFLYNTIGLQNLGITILEISVLSRLVFHPFAKQQSRYSKKMSDLAPHLKTLKDKHKDNKQAFATAQMALFKEHGVNPASGCLPGIVQLVILIGLYNALSQTFALNWNTHFFLWDLTKPDVFHIAGLSFPLPGALVVLAALTQFIQTKMMMPARNASHSDADGPTNKKVDSKEEKKDLATDFAEVQSSMAWMFPLMFLFIGLQFASGLALYWTISSVVAIFQQYKISGVGGLQPYVVKLRQLQAKHSQ